MFWEQGDAFRGLWAGAEETFKCSSEEEGKKKRARARSVALDFFLTTPSSLPPLLSRSLSLSLSLSRMFLVCMHAYQKQQPDGGEWVRRLRRHQQRQRQQKDRQQKQRRPGPPSSSSSSTPPQPPPGSSSGLGGGGNARGPAPPRVASRAPPSSSSLRPFLPARNRKNSGGKTDPSGDAPRCPLRDWPVLGALLPLAAGGETLGLNCPQAIVALRAAVARVPQVRSLRPRPLWLKGAAVVAAGAAANAPFGAWRTHTKKFSLEWFVAVHATVPFVAALRQATLLPKWALVLTIAGAVAGQMLGARVEDARQRAVEKRRSKQQDRESEKEAAKTSQRQQRQNGTPAAAPERGFSLPPFLLRSGGGMAKSLTCTSSSVALRSWSSEREHSTNTGKKFRVIQLESAPPPLEFKKKKKPL